MTGRPGQPAGAPRLPPAYRLIRLDTVESTNDEAARLAGQGAEEGTLVWARAQTRGRGRRQRDFASPPGNLYFSLVLRPECDARTAAQLSFVAALAVGEAIGSVAPPLLEVTYKWPNDVLLNGRKVSGILLESRADAAGGLDWLVLGVGINVQSFPEDTGFPATGLHFEGVPRDVSEGDVLQAFARSFLSWTNRWLEDGFAPVRQAWLNHAHGRGETITVHLPREKLTGIFRDLDRSGALVLELADGERRVISAGDVYFTG